MRNAEESATANDHLETKIENDFDTKLQLTEKDPEDGNATSVNFYDDDQDSVVYVNYKDERQMPDIMRLIQKDLSEPYSIYTYRYFIHNWPNLCFLVSYF